MRVKLLCRIQVVVMQMKFRCINENLVPWKIFYVPLTAQVLHNHPNITITLVIQRTICTLLCQHKEEVLNYLTFLMSP